MLGIEQHGCNFSFQEAQQEYGCQYEAIQDYRATQWLKTAKKKSSSLLTMKRPIEVVLNLPNAVTL